MPSSVWSVVLCCFNVRRTLLKSHYSHNRPFNAKCLHCRIKLNTSWKVQWRDDPASSSCSKSKLETPEQCVKSVQIQKERHHTDVNVVLLSLFLSLNKFLIFLSYCSFWWVSTGWKSHLFIHKCVEYYNTGKLWIFQIYLLVRE